ncbi:protein-export chaperone SecB [Thiorhodospira sibirica]|uniref:protein-export chaperone SecB n=1 Tax=Thiorhodospira sibirica TaxID=154347 RepID=UPI00022C4075|nr:protein-export chaperone SecB [Thiorhodospira sibirica]
MTDNADQAAVKGPENVPAQPEFSLQKIYTKDASFESPRAPQIFTGDWKPETNVQLNSQARALDDQGLHEVELSVTVTTTSHEQTAFLVEVKQAGIFVIRGFEPQQMGHLLAAYCPGILFPYAREVISDLVSKGGFPQMLLAPVNFDALYAQQLQQQNAGASSALN